MRFTFVRLAFEALSSTIFRKPTLMSPTRIGFDGAGSSRVELPKVVAGSDPVEGDKEVKINLDGEPGSLLDSLNAWREKVTAGVLWGIFGLSRRVELKLLDLLTSQLDRELVSHNVTVAEI